LNIIVRADASHTLGSGHVMRCLTLADRLREHDADIQFISQRLPGEMSQTVTAHHYPCHLVEPTIRADCQHESPAAITDLHTDAQATIGMLPNGHCDWLVVDQYQLHGDWYHRLRPHCGHILTLDDLANRLHHCDLLQDQTLGRKATDYRRHTRKSCRLLLGTEYALLRPEFAAQRQRNANAIPRSDTVRHLLIALGGSDKHNLALDILQRIEPLLQHLDITAMLVAGPQYQHAQTVRDWAAGTGTRVEVHHDVREVAPLLMRADLAIGASGSSAWERCCLGLPTLACVFADNQLEIANQLASAGASINWHTLDELYRLLEQLLDGRAAMGETDATDALPDISLMSRAAAQICDGNGAQRVVDAMMSV